MSTRTDLTELKAEKQAPEPEGAARKRLWIGGSAVVITLACVVWIAIALLSPPAAPPIGEALPASKFIESIADAQLKHYWEFANVIIQPSPDGQKVLISGTVKTQAHMDLLSGVLKAGQPQVPIENTVRVGQ